MIDCPICHVMNEDMARFCAECGQRLTRSAQPGQQPAKPLKPEQSVDSPVRVPRLHSPLLSADTAESPSAASKPDLSRLRGTARPSTESASGKAAMRVPPVAAGGQGCLDGAHHGLRSPLLGASDAEATADDEMPAATGGRELHLHSPLLQSDEDIYEDAHASKLPGRGRLKSPLLPEDDEDYPPTSARAQHKGLHSPLLSGDTDDEYPLSSVNQRSHKGLHSPLLGGDTDDEYPLSSVNQRSHKGLHSPLLSGDTDDEYPLSSVSQRSHKGLHSPLLGGDTDDEYPLSSTGQAGGRHHLRSPLLGGDDSGDERSQGLSGASSLPIVSGSSFDEPDNIDDPRVLRSPLLASRVPVHDRSQVTPVGVNTEPQVPSKLAEDLQQASAVPPAALSSAASRANLSSNSISSPYYQAEAQSGGGTGRVGDVVAPAAQQPPAAGQPAAPLLPGFSQSADASAASSVLPPQADAWITGVGSGQPSSQAVLADEVPAGNLSGLRGISSRANAAPPGQADKKYRYKALEERESGSASQDRSRTGSHTDVTDSPALHSFIKLMVVPLALVAGMKVLSTLEFVKSQQPFIPVVADQVGQLIVCVCLIIICISAGKSRL